MHEVWVTGAGIVSALGSGCALHASALDKMQSGLSRHALFDGRPPDPCLCGIAPGHALPRPPQAHGADRANLLLTGALLQALQHAALMPPYAVDFVAGTASGNIAGASEYYRAIRAGQPTDISLVEYGLPYAPVEAAAYAAGLTGRRWAVSSSCGSASAAIGTAFRLVRHGRSSCVLAGGVEALSAYLYAGFHTLRLTSNNACRPFDAEREGLVPGEGAAVIVVESRESAAGRGAPPLARLDGFGEATETYSLTSSHPEGTGPAAAIRAALTEAQLTPSGIAHAHLHGTGTQANDLSEYRACKLVFGNRLARMPVWSTKALTGHTVGAAGGIAAVFSLLSLQSGTVPGTRGFQSPDAAMEGLCVSAEPRPAGAGAVLTTTLGFGGEAYALVMSRVECGGGRT